MIKALKTIGFVLLGIFCLLCSLVMGVSRPIGTTLVCQKSDQICQLNFRHMIRGDDILRFNFSDVQKVYSDVTTISRYSTTYGLQIILKQGKVLQQATIDDFPEAKKGAQQLASYLHDPKTDTLMIDPHSDVKNCFGALLLLAVGLLAPLRAWRTLKKEHQNTSKLEL